MESKDKLMEMLCMELDEIAEKGEMSAGDLDTVYKLIVAKEKLLRIDELEENLGYSNDGGWRAEGSYSRNRYMMDNGNSYKGRSYSRSNRGRYSMADGKQMIIEKMHELMNSGELSQSEHNTIKKAMDVLER